MTKRTTSYFVVPKVIGELAELIKNKVHGVFIKFITSVINFFDIAFGANSLDDILGRVGAPFVKPIKTFLAHTSRKNRHAATTHDATNRHTATGVVAS